MIPCYFVWILDLSRRPLHCIPYTNVHLEIKRLPGSVSSLSTLLLVCRFCTIFKQFELDIKTIINSLFFFLSFLPNYVIKTFPTKINTYKIKLKSIIFELFIISKLNETYIYLLFGLYKHNFTAINSD